MKEEEEQRERDNSSLEGKEGKKRKRYDLIISNSPVKYILNGSCVGDSFLVMLEHGLNKIRNCTVCLF